MGQNISVNSIFTHHHINGYNLPIRIQGPLQSNAIDQVIRVVYV